MKEQATNRKSSRQTTKVERFVIQSESVQSNKKLEQHLAKDGNDSQRVIKCSPANPGAKCAICRTDRVDEMLLGEFLSCSEAPEGGKTLEDVNSDVTSVHYACLLTACNLCQQVDEDLELRGFTVASVKKEVRRCSSECCVFCKKKGAVVGCCLKRCKRMFHFPCALENGVITEFYGVYNSWCDHHAQPQIIPEQADGACCPICADEFENRPLFHCACCSNVLHKDCLRPYVFNAGTYYLKCPFCQDVDTFKDLIDRYCGIHIPTREPTYEDHDRMVVELVCCYEFCPDPDKCVDNEDWRLIKCIICGGRAMHVMCVAKAFVHQRFVCPDCGDNDSYESSYRVLTRMGSGTEVGRMFPWQFLSLTQLVHSVKIPHCDENGELITRKDALKLRNDESTGEDGSSVKSSTRGGRKIQVWSSRKKSKVGKETEEIEICFEKRGTKEILGEIEFSSDEEPTQEDDQQIAQQSDRTETKSIVDEEMLSVENCFEVQQPKKGGSKSRGRPKKVETSKKKKSVTTQNRTTAGKTTGSSSKNEMVTKNVLPANLPSKSMENESSEAFSLDKSSSKENRRPHEIRSSNRVRTRGLTPSKKPKYEEPVYLSSDSSDSFDDSTESSFLRLRGVPVPPTQRSFKPACNHRVELMSPAKTSGSNSVTFKRPVRDSGSMRKVVIGGRSSTRISPADARATFEDVSPGGDIENSSTNSGVNGGAHHFHFHSCNSSKQISKTENNSSAVNTNINNNSALMSSIHGSSTSSSALSKSTLFSAYRQNSIPLSVNTHHVIHNLQSPLSVDANQRVTRASVGGSNPFDAQQYLHSC